jgi:hypothetical protein
LYCHDNRVIKVKRKLQEIKKQYLVKKEEGGETGELRLAEGAQEGHIGGGTDVAVEPTVLEYVGGLGMVDEGVRLELLEGGVVDAYLGEILRRRHVVDGTLGKVAYDEQFFWGEKGLATLAQFYYATGEIGAYAWYALELGGVGCIDVNGFSLTELGPIHCPISVPACWLCLRSSACA